MALIHVVSPLGQQAQYPEEQLWLMWQQGTEPEGHYWKEGMEEWRPLAELFAQRETPVETSASLSPYGMTFSNVKDPRRLTAFLLFMLLISLSFAVVELLCEAVVLHLLITPFREADYNAITAVQGWIGLGDVIVSIITAVAFLKWIYRANVNSQGFGAQGMRFTPGWSIGYYFVPFLNLVRPYQAMKEIWQVSRDPYGWKEVKDLRVVKQWWAWWLTANAFLSVSTKMYRRAETLGAYQVATLASILALGLFILLCLAAIKLVREIAQRQEQLVAGSLEAELAEEICHPAQF